MDPARFHREPDVENLPTDFIGCPSLLTRHAKKKKNFKFEYLIFFHLLTINFFSILVYMGSKHIFLPQKKFSWNLSFCDSINEGMPKSTKSIEFP